MTLYLIDVSSHQQSIPIEALPGQGFSAVIIKATQGTGYINPCFADHLRRAKATGRLLVAAYHFLAPGNGAGQAAHAASVVPADVPIWWDQEAGSSLSDSVAAAAEASRRGRRTAGNYGSRPPKGWGWWRAAYLTDPTGYASTTYAQLGGDTSAAWGPGQDLWQYCQHGRVSGYSGDVDFSAYRGTLDQLVATGWFWVPDALKRPHSQPATGRVVDVSVRVAGTAIGVGVHEHADQDARCSGDVELQLQRGDSSWQTVWRGPLVAGAVKVDLQPLAWHPGDWTVRAAYHPSLPTWAPASTTTVVTTH